MADVELQPIAAIARKIGIPEDDLETFGRYSAKVSLARLPATGAPPKGKLILVTGITPTSAGEGKTVTTIGLAQGLERLGKQAIATLREPSLGPVFGVKGGATGGGKSQVLPAEKINLHFNGDKHAVTAAHNLLAAMLDAHIYHGNELRIDPATIAWPRVVDMNDRALRQIETGLGGKANGAPRRARFVITAASEVMAILALAQSADDCARRLGAITVGFNTEGAPVHADDLRAVGAMMVLLNDALRPNLVQTTEQTPALIHAGPFGNIAHGTCSVIAQRMALALAEYVVNEAGFGADLGAEKYLDIVMPSSGIKPAAAVLVATVRALKRHDPASAALTAGLDNLAKHIENLRKYHLPLVVALNRFPDDREEELQTVKTFCAGLGVEAALSDVFAKGGAGALELGESVFDAANKVNLDRVQPLYRSELGIEAKIARIASEIYGASAVEFSAQAKEKIAKFSALGFGHLPVCVAKTQNSLSDDPKKLGAPKDWTLTISDANLSSGAGYIVAVAGNMLLMPGLPKVPQAVKMHLTSDGTISGVS
ncbi:MAG TPA: formate--tetrahydrofolate ligase [Candidatus Binatia bacterium]